MTRADEATVDLLIASFLGASRMADPFVADTTLKLHPANAAGMLLWMHQGDLRAARASLERMPPHRTWLAAEMYLSGAERNARALPLAAGGDV